MSSRGRQRPISTDLLTGDRSRPGDFIRLGRDMEGASGGAGGGDPSPQGGVMTMGRKDLVEIKRRLLQVRAVNPSRVTDDRVAPAHRFVVFPVISFPALGRPALMMRQQLTYPSRLPRSKRSSRVRTRRSTGTSSPRSCTSRRRRMSSPRRSRGCSARKTCPCTTSSSAESTARPGRNSRRSSRRKGFPWRGWHPGEPARVPQVLARRHRRRGWEEDRSREELREVSRCRTR